MNNKLTPLPDYGSLYTLEEFIELCEDGSFIDYDGYGCYAFKDKMSDKCIHPSDVTGNYSWFDFNTGEFNSKKIPVNIDKNFTHILWFNR